ncbi:hypothetical protein ColTof4_09793 [Colletotrichum tofieldiae]|nr:hypothetical protein ColTof3_05149 [Colletotrichum tofieldiae]GKT77370.1 hypothetical protein ColTof4_09793 [Colletotrichum tofieldiae]GKT86231.1 hypothetical protein Ct61P_04081 [Colletotrichum tofieldiae]
MAYRRPIRSNFEAGGGKSEAEPAQIVSRLSWQWYQVEGSIAGDAYGTKDKYRCRKPDSAHC